MFEFVPLILLVLTLTYSLSYLITKKTKQKSITLIVAIPIFYLFYFIVYSLLNNGVVAVNGGLNAAIVFSNIIVLVVGVLALIYRALK